MEVEPLQLLPEEKWQELESNLKLDWPRSIFVINMLQTLKRLPDLRRSFNFKVYCPYGDVTLGVVATCTKQSFHEVIIHCSRELQTFLRAIKESKVIHWDQVLAQFTNRRVMESVVSTIRSRSIEWWHLESCDVIYLDTNLLEIQMPEEVTFGLLTVEHTKLINSTWEHQYPGSEWYFEQLIKCNLGYGLFEKGSNKLVAWSLYTEFGTFDYLYVLESYRKKGYGEIISKFAHNSTYKDKGYSYGLCVKGNNTASTLFERIGFKIVGDFFYAIFKCKTQSKI